MGWQAVAASPSAPMPALPQQVAAGELLDIGLVGCDLLFLHRVLNFKRIHTFFSILYAVYVQNCDRLTLTRQPRAFLQLP